MCPGRVELPVNALSTASLCRLGYGRMIGPAMGTMPVFALRARRGSLRGRRPACRAEAPWREGWRTRQDSNLRWALRQRIKNPLRSAATVTGPIDRCALAGARLRGASRYATAGSLRGPRLACQPKRLGAKTGAPSRFCPWAFRLSGGCSAAELKVRLVRAENFEISTFGL